MSNFRKYEKIHRLGKEETDGILFGTCYIQEKIDGANTSIWVEDGELCMGSRNRKLGEEEFNGFVPYIKKHDGVNKLLSEMPSLRLYGEWLIRHTLPYPETAYKQFYLFDIHDGEKYLSIEDVYDLAERYGIKTATLFTLLTDPTEEQIRDYVGKSVIGEEGEGVVIKNPKFINQFGDRTCAKIVTQ